MRYALCILQHAIPFLSASEREKKLFLAIPSTTAAGRFLPTSNSWRTGTSNHAKLATLTAPPAPSSNRKRSRWRAFRCIQRRIRQGPKTGELRVVFCHDRPRDALPLQADVALLQRRAGRHWHCCPTLSVVASRSRLTLWLAAFRRRRWSSRSSGRASGDGRTEGSWAWICGEAARCGPCRRLWRQACRRGACSFRGR